MLSASLMTPVVVSPSESTASSVPAFTVVGVYPASVENSTL